MQENGEPGNGFNAMRRRLGLLYFATLFAGLFRGMRHPLAHIQLKSQ